jgi:succinate dehydrogenase / fumarate reductase iron-sulfur subunit
MATETTTFKILRFDPATDESPYYRDYSLDVTPGMTVLEALLRIQMEQDGSLAFRYACRGAVCGSCAMLINGREELACRTQVLGLGKAQWTVYEGAGREPSETEFRDDGIVTVEPLRNLPVLKDLVVDMEPFFGNVQHIEPWLQPDDPDPERERLVLPDDWKEAEPYTNCILCSCCHSVCPAGEQDREYLGPAALAQHYRFLADARDGAAEGRMALVDKEQGVWGCDMVRYCMEVCPRGVTPTMGIGRTRARIKRAQRGQ